MLVNALKALDFSKRLEHPFILTELRFKDGLNLKSHEDQLKYFGHHVKDLIFIKSKLISILWRFYNIHIINNRWIIRISTNSLLWTVTELRTLPRRGQILSYKSSQHTTMTRRFWKKNSLTWRLLMDLPNQNTKTRRNSLRSSNTCQ